MIAIIDYGMGNLRSVQKAFEYLGFEAVVTSDTKIMEKADKLVLPGVGAFGDAIATIREKSFDKVIYEATDKKKPFLGICLGMQMVFDKSYEYGEHAGLGLLPGSVRPIAPVIGPGRKVPHIGWNALSFPENKPKSPLFAQVDAGECVYFVHSFAAMECDAVVSATAEYGVSLTAAAELETVMGAQFHPEKSGDVGLRILHAFCAL